MSQQGFSISFPPDVELSHVYKMAEYFWTLNRGYEVSLRKRVEIENGPFQIVHGRASSNDPQEACDMAYHELKKKEASASADHAAHLEQVAKLQSYQPPLKVATPQHQETKFTSEDLGL